MKKFEEWMDKRGSEFEMLCIVLFWILVFDPIIYIVTGDMDCVVTSQFPFVVLILMPYILWRTRKKWTRK